MTLNASPNVQVTDTQITKDKTINFVAMGKAKAIAPTPIFAPLTNLHQNLPPTTLELSAEYPQFERLYQSLVQSGFTVELALPPVEGNYGLLDRNSRTVWINPVVFELGIAQHTLVHEAVHAAQLCASPDELLPLGLGLDPPHIVKPYFMRYSGMRRLVEAEAYTVQALDNNVEYAIGLLTRYCTSL